MSEFRQVTKHLEALETCLTQLQHSVANKSDHVRLEQDLIFLLAALNGDVGVMMEKFRARCFMVDPVTKQPRFGPKMLAKVQDVLRRYDDVALRMEKDAPFHLQVVAKIHQLKEEEAAKKEEKAARERKAQTVQRAVELAREQKLQQEARDQEAKRQRDEQLRIKALATAAHKKRDRHEKERAEKEQQQKLEEQERERLNASIPHGKEGLEKSIAMLQESTGSEMLFRQSLVKLLGVVSNICSVPENAAFRHIPKDNVNFHSDLGQYAGGHQCLLALGFKELQQGYEAQPRAVFVLEEPDLSEDLDAWTSWFDELKEMQSLVESKLY
ncbi:unnamed protein product [Peronospora destructor]|uniref:PUB domain-containing protein n=1 Tax=Peronospora destructor TaxID=86335 RepID=A0AAV0U1Z6_9STRA|nr:unnamed protein product [Peronospora destructor]